MRHRAFLCQRFRFASAIFDADAATKEKIKRLSQLPSSQNGRARRPFAPSLDRIDSNQPYSRRNCRLVLQAVNFALNAWGDDVFLAIAEDAIKLRGALASSE
jgi:hypothetical protein